MNKKDYAGARRKTGPQARPIEARFFEKIKKVESGCWLWVGALTGKGYGNFCWSPARNNREYVGAHIASWRIHNGEVPSGMVVCHHCDNPRCVNPVHLFVGTQHDNVRDCISKGRTSYKTGINLKLQGSRHPNAKLTEDQVRSVLSDMRSYAKIAKDLGVSASTVHQIKTHQTWTHVNAGFAGSND